MSHPTPGPLDVPLLLQVALDLLAPRLPGAGTIVASAPTTAAARLWVRADATARPDCVLCLYPADRQQLAGASRDVPVGGRLGVLAGGPLAAVLGRVGSVPSGLGARAAARLIVDSGFRIELKCGIGGIEAAAWALVARLAARVDRPDLVDRLDLRYRRAVAVRPDSRLPLAVAMVARRW